MDLEKKYTEMIEQFQGQIARMMGQATSAVDDLKKNAQINFDELQNEYVKGHQELIAQLTKANNDLITSYKTNYDSLKANLVENYNGLVNQAKSNYDSNVAKFKDNTEEALKKVPVLSPKVFQDALASLNNSQNNSIAAFEKMYADLQTHFEKGYHESLKKLALTVIDGGVQTGATGASAQTKQTPAPAKPTPAPAPAAAKPQAPAKAAAPGRVPVPAPPKK